MFCRSWIAALCLAPAATSCTSGDDVDGTGSGGAGQIASGGSSGASSTSGGATSTGGEVILDPSGAGGSSGADADGGSCKSASSEATMKPVVLAFAFDVSGSMGEGDEPWHDKALKWDPVVAATQAFFTDSSSKAISASVTFFPEKASDDVKCAAATYETPDVPLTALPSAAFGRAIEVVETEDWGDGTPTIYVVRGVIDSVQKEASRNPDPAYAMVLVTDGYPQDCVAAGENDIETVAAEVAGVASTIPTYVIGVANPPVANAPDTVTDLHRIAQQGGTGQAFIIDTGNAVATSTTFRAAIDAIRGTAVSCTVDIPVAPAGKTFDAEKVVVTYESGVAEMPFTYDASCVAPNAWHYDEPSNPTQIVLCTATCATVQADLSAKLSVAFTCERQIIIR